MTDRSPHPLAVTPAVTPVAETPRVPRSKLSPRAIGLGVFGAIVLASYGAVAYTDFEPGAPSREQIPASVRSSPGGYRSFHFWHSGYHGGK